MIKIKSSVCLFLSRLWRNAEGDLKFGASAADLILIMGLKIESSS
jgi:hypothetical protein